MNHDISKEEQNKRLFYTVCNYLFEKVQRKLSRFVKRIFGREIIITNNYYLKYKIKISLIKSFFNIPKTSNLKVSK